jgi:hypothetical protein
MIENRDQREFNLCQGGNMTQFDSRTKTLDFTMLMAMKALTVLEDFIGEYSLKSHQAAFILETWTKGHTVKVILDENYPEHVIVISLEFYNQQIGPTLIGISLEDFSGQQTDLINQRVYAEVMAK